MRTSLLLVIAFSNTLSAAPIDYQKEIKPLLKARCYACHGALKQEAKLRLDTVAGLLTGGRDGPAIIPGKPDESRLVHRVEAKSEDERMPLEGLPLEAAQIAKLRTWIAEGAQGPATETPEPDPRDHWAFQKPKRAALPPGAAHPIDAFINERLQQQGLAPRPAASKEVLLRRVYLDLLGLPPTRDELLAFVADQSPNAYESVVDRLLLDPRHGERWARHWMDVWRYSDWYGRRHVPDVWNSAPQIWRWRDWIVRSLNRDHGYDRLLREMLAADEICPTDDEATVATGYLIRNWYALNPNDWMRNTVEHTGKAFLGLTFNCCHCHDHKYDPLAQDDYFRLRAFFEPIGIRQDREPGEADPGPFQEYDYSTLRKIQRLGAVRIFDKKADAPTWFYTGGDERNRVRDRGSLAPGVPAVFAAWLRPAEPVALPPQAWYPGLRPSIQETVRETARAAVAQAETDLAATTTTEVPPAIREQLAQAEAAYEAALKAAREAGQGGAISGRQSLLLDATVGRRIVNNGVQSLKRLDDGTVIEFQLQIVRDAHVNFQLAKHVVQGLTAGLVAFEKGRIVAYQPNSFSEFEAGRYDPANQRRFQIRLRLETKLDRALLSVRSVGDDKLLVDAKPVALNGWNPVGDPTKGITFDSHTGSVALFDDVNFFGPTSDGAAPERLLHFDFEPPTYTDGRDVVGIDGWTASPFSMGAATSVVSSTAGNESLRELLSKVQTARRTVESTTLPQRIAEARLAAAKADQESVAARLAAEQAKHQSAPGADISPLAKSASTLERTAAVRRATAEVLDKERAVAIAEAKPATDASRAKELDAATKGLATARGLLDKANAAFADVSLAEKYSGFGPVYPRESTGRRRAFAEWLTHSDQPLTARVAINHIWLRHFHSPLVATVHDFGRNGSPPTHPELLDWLAVEFMESGWSMRHIHRLIVTSDAYRRVSSSSDAPLARQMDPENRLLWRMNVGRMESEAVRDSLLFCVGKLDLKQGGQELENAESLTTRRRSLYYAVYPEQGGKSSMGELFDAPDALDCYRRTQSIVPQQALVLTNSDFVHRLSAEYVADWQARSPDATDEAFVREAFERILSRSPTEAETRACVVSLEQQRRVSKQPRESLVRALFNVNDFVAIR